MRFTLKNMTVVTVTLMIFVLIMAVPTADAKMGPHKFKTHWLPNAKLFIEEDGRLFNTDGKPTCECPNTAATCKCKILVMGNPMTPDECFDFYRVLPTYSWEDADYMYFDCRVNSHDLFNIEKPGDKVRINAQLIDARTDKHLWAEQYDRDLKDIFAVQDDITKKHGLGFERQILELR